MVTRFNLYKMPTREITTILQTVTAVDIQQATADGTIVGNIINVSDANGGASFIISIGDPASDSYEGTFVPLIEHGYESDLSDATSVDEVDLVKQDPSSSSPAEEQAVISSLTPAIRNSKIGYIGARPYVRLSILCENVEIGGATVSAFLLLKQEVAPTT